MSHTLFLTAGKLCRIIFRLFLQPDALEQLYCLFLGICLAHQLLLDRCQRQVVHDIQMIKQIEVLEHHAQLLANLVDVGALVQNIRAVKNNLTAGRLFQTVQAAQKRTLTGTGRANDNNALALVDLAVDFLENFQFAEAFL